MKGVCGDIISDVLSDLDCELMQQRLLARIERKAKSVKYKDQYDLKRKLVAYGLSLGFAYDMVLDTVSKIVTDDDE